MTPRKILYNEDIRNTFFKEKEMTEAQRTAQTERKQNVLRVNTAIIVCRTLKAQGRSAELETFKQRVAEELTTLATENQINHILSI